MAERVREKVIVIMESHQPEAVSDSLRGEIAYIMAQSETFEKGACSRLRKKQKLTITDRSVLDKRRGRSLWRKKELALWKERS